jgi:membrane protein YqaA with SNARE-associated domain
VSLVADPTGTGLLLGLAAGGAASGLVPVINAEALLTAAAAASPALWLAASVSITVGQCAAKLLIYLAARSGPQRLNREGRANGVLRRVAGGFGRPRPGSSSPGLLHVHRGRLLSVLRAPLPGTGVVLLSAAVGLPPLAVVSAVAGVARLRVNLFVAACLVGRLVRFGAIAWPVAHLVTTTR